MTRRLAPVLCLLAAPALAQPTPLPPGAPEAAGSEARAPDLAYGAYQRGLFITALKEAAARLERDPDDGAAMTLMGELFNQGLGVRQDPAKAADWFRLAAREGDPNALFALGMMALEGRGMERDRAQARVRLEEAAAKGHPAASYNLALLLLTSDEAADVARAADLLRVAAESEIPDAQHALGVLYAKGRGVATDKAEAARWLARAAANGNVAGQVEYAIALFNGDGAPAEEPGAARLFRRAAAKGNAIAQNRLARLYAAGRGVAKNPVEAAAWHLLASAQGLADPWLDQALRGLTDEERARAEKLAAGRSPS